MTQFRADEGLAFMLQYENVAWYDAGEVRILDRRVYPAKTEFVRCKTHVEVMQAIRDMVTQSAGPYTAAAMGMALAAYECREKTEAEGRHICMIASICGTDLDPQDYQKQKKTLEDLGVIVLESNGRAALLSGLIAKEVQK